MDLNSVIFKGTTADKRSAVESATQRELLNVSVDTIKKILSKQSADKYYPDRKTLYFGNVSNHWNADAKSVELYKGKVFINFYVQYSNTDTDTCDYLDKFLRGGDYRGAVNYTDMYDNPHTSYYRFDQNDKANVVKAILLTYIDNCEKKG